MCVTVSVSISMSVSLRDCEMVSMCDYVSVRV